MFTKKKRGFWLLILCLSVSLLFVACGEKLDHIDPPSSSPLTIIGGENEYVIVYNEKAPDSQKYATALRLQLKSKTGVTLKMVKDSEPVSDYEIVIGPTNRPFSLSLARQVEDGSRDFRWGMLSSGTSVAIDANSELGWDKLFSELLRDYLSDGSITLPAGLNKTGIFTYEEYLKEQNPDDGPGTGTGGEKEEQNQELIAQLKAQLGEYDIDDFGGSEITRDLQSKWDSPPVTPTVGQHPRLLFTAEDLPTLRKAFSDTENFPDLVAAYRLLISDASDGTLPAAKQHDLGFYNYDAKTLIIIQAKALAYQLTGNEVYGYQAITSLLNNIKSLDIGYFNDDQWRRYGHTMYTAALVYDWCYDLLDADTKLLITSGVEHLVCSGTSNMPDKAHHGGVKMEMGFPPLKSGGTIVGHSSETQFMRDYFSFAIAIFDEVPEWWDMIGGRFFAEYVEPRQYIYSVGTFAEGTAGYTQMRFLTDLRCYWLMSNALSYNPFENSGMENIARSFFTFDQGNGDLFRTGDGNGSTIMTNRDQALLSSFLFSDSVMRSAYDELMHGTYNQIVYDHTALSPLEVLICLSSELPTTTNWRAELPTAAYYKGFAEEMIIRDGWNGSDTAAVYMSGAGLSSGGHNHESVGNFKIAYKGVLSADGGQYDKWGSNHHYYYHQGTISHNSLLIYNPDLAGTNDGYYSGGQIKKYGDISYDWRTGEFWKQGYIKGAEIRYHDDAMEHPAYAYYATDMTKSYSSLTVDYVGRSMLTVYTEDPDFPMLLFVFDRIDATNKDFRKSFLLQCVAEPEIDGNTVTVSNGEGKLVLTSLLGGYEIEAYGGKDQFYLPDSNQYLNPEYSTKTGEMWGRVEISPHTGRKSDLLMNVMYVTDDGNTEVLTPALIEDDLVVGAYALDHTAIFMKSQDYQRESFTFETTVDEEGQLMNYYVGGLASAMWTVSVDGVEVGTYGVTMSGHMLSFSSDRMGVVTVTRAD